MQYIVMDLEWNTAFCKKTGEYFNEIIEIGAVKLDKEFNPIDTISLVVKAQIEKKLRGRVKELTHITNEEVFNGMVFPQAVKELTKWLGDEPSTLLTWGDGDIRVLVKNYDYFLHTDIVPFVNSYADVQKYCQSFLVSKAGQQMGLSAACEQLEINPDDFSHHRALDDSLMTVACVRKVFDNEKLEKYTRVCDNDFYKRLAFKPYIIKDLNSPVVDKSKLACVCDVCGGKVVKKKKWRYSNQSFRAEFYCPSCDRSFRLCVRYKQCYDKVEIKRRFSEIASVKVENKV